MTQDKSQSSHGPSEEGAGGRVRFSTTNLPLRHQFAAWKETINPMLDASLPAEKIVDDPFFAEMTAYNLGGLLFSIDKFDPVTYELSANALRRGNVDHWLLYLNKAGMITSRIGDSVSECSTGSLALRSLTRPFTGRASAVEALIVYIPRDLFPDLAAHFDALNGKSIAGGLTSLLSAHLLSLEQQLPLIASSELPDVGHATKSMIASCLAPSKTRLSEAMPQLSLTLLAQAERYIRKHIHVPTLSPSHVARFLGVSRSQLYRLFEDRGGVAREIRVQRLNASHAALMAWEERRPIFEIAHDFGFASADEFGRAFKRQYGCSPSEARKFGTEKCSRLQPTIEADFTSWIVNLGR